MNDRTGFLTVYSADRSQIYGEFVDAEWKEEQTGGGTNHLFSGKPSQGTLDTFQRINAEGIDHVSFDFSTGDGTYRGTAQLLRPQDSLISIETGTAPAKA